MSHIHEMEEIKGGGHILLAYNRIFNLVPQLQSSLWAFHGYDCSVFAKELQQPRLFHIHNYTLEVKSMKINDNLLSTPPTPGKDF